MVEGKSEPVPQEDKLIAVVGPTATGKTRRAVSLAGNFHGEIISADSRQIYKGMDLGTGKDLEEYGEVPYHLINICEAGEKYNLYRYIKDFHESLAQIRKRGNVPILCGGTGMYIETALSGMDLPDVPVNTMLRKELADKNLEELTEILKKYKKLHNTTDIDTTKRAIRAIEIEYYYCTHPEEAMKADRKKASPLNAFIIGIDIPREERRRRISERLGNRLKNGMVDEVRALLNRGLSPDDLIYYGLEYKFLTLYVTGQLKYEDMVRDLEIAIHQFAKRQMTWFRGMEKRGFKINWLPFDLTEEEFLSRVKELW